MKGKVYLIGAGPGAVDLLTLRAARILGEADVLLYDALVNPEIVALAQRAQKIAVGKRHGRYSTAQAFINKRLVDCAKQHACVVRLKGGDPLLFGRAQEELDALAAAGIEVEIVSGVTAALAAGGRLGVSLTRRGLSRSVTFVTPRVGRGERPGDWVAAALAADTAAIYMGAGEAESIANALISGGMPPRRPVAIVADATLPDETLLDGVLEDLPSLARKSGVGPATILIGEVLADRTRSNRAAGRVARRSADKAPVTGSADQATAYPPTRSRSR